MTYDIPGFSPRSTAGQAPFRMTFSLFVYFLTKRLWVCILTIVLYCMYWSMMKCVYGIDQVDAVIAELKKRKSKLVYVA